MITLMAFGQPDGHQPEESRPSRSVFVPTPQDVVEKMLELADVKNTDIVYDLGSGDGRILITAASKYGCKAVGFEIDQQLVQLSRNKVKEASVEPLVTVNQQDLFAADLSDATVITLYLLPEQLKALIPRLMKVKTGTRIVSHQFQIPGIKSHTEITVHSHEDGNEHKLYLWTAPIHSRPTTKE
jgi:ribosomal protein L11 methylase PrmA